MAYIPFLAPLKPDLLGSPRASGPPLPAGATLFSRGREIIAAAVPALGLRAGDVVLAPASLCWEALAPLLAHGLVVRCYPLDAQLRIDPEAVRALADDRTRAIYAVHYFGFPQDLASLRAWCDDSNRRLIEDCALCHFDGDGKGGIGRAGDVSLFSLWKYLPIPDGAVALVRGDLRIEAPSGRGATPRGTARAALRLALAGAAMTGLVPLAALRRMRPVRIETAPAVPPGAASMPRPHAMSGMSLRILRRIDPATAAAARRANYRALVEALRGIAGVRPLWPELPEEVVPFALPIHVPDPVTLSRALSARGVETEISINRFFRGHPRILGEARAFSAVDDLADHVLSLPVHQGISLRLVQRVARSVREAL